MNGPSQATPDAQEALAMLGAVIADPEQRRAFAVDARATLENAGVAAQHLPDPLIDRLGSMNYEELTIIAKHCEELVAHGFWVELPNGGKACLF